MTDNHQHNHFVILAIILIVGLGLALALPWLLNLDSLASQNNDAPTQSDHCYVKNSTSAAEYDTTDATALQQAVDEAASEDVLKVAGTCKGVNSRAGFDQTVIITKNLTLIGGYSHIDWNMNPDPETYTTTLDANKSGRVAVISGNINVTLDGFSFTGGLANDGTLFDHGGGIWTNTNLTLKNSHVFSNTSPNNGGGFFCYGYGSGNECNPSLTEVSFTGNSALFGGGLYNNGFDGISNPELINVNFTGNSATYGGGMYNSGREFGDSSPSLTNVVFTNNSAVYGGALYNNGAGNGNSSPNLANVVFSGNVADHGGAMYNNGRDSGIVLPKLTNVTISGNLGLDKGGGIFSYGSSNGNCRTDIINSILWNNQDDTGTGTISSTIFISDTAFITLTHSLVQDSGGSGSGWIGGSYVDGGDNIDEDPMFIMPINPSTAPTTAGNLRLQTGSPAIDAGDNIFVPPDVLIDLDGEPRIVDGTLDGTLTVDMGAYEVQIDYPYDDYLPMIFR